MSAPGNRIEADPTEAIVLGDTVWDAQAGRRAGVPTAAVLSGGIARQANSFGGNDFPRLGGQAKCADSSQAGTDLRPLPSSRTSVKGSPG
jgi:beta-phosphoglucomutase-like phosphatase (HAD superfamily)